MENIHSIEDSNSRRSSEILGFEISKRNSLAEPFAMYAEGGNSNLTSVSVPY